MHRKIFALAAMAVSFVSTSLNAATYTFENLPLGPMTQSDNWYKPTTSHSRIQSGQGVNTSHVFACAEAGTVTTARRWCDVSFGLPIPRAGECALIGLDFRTASSAVTGAELMFGIFSSQQDEPFWPNFLGVRYDLSSNYDWLLIPCFDGSAVANGLRNFDHIHGDWYHVEVLLDFTGPNAVGSMSVQNLSAGAPLAPISVLQQIDLLLPTNIIDQQGYDAIFLAAGNIQVDNLLITIVPEPVTNSMVISMLLALHRQRRARCRTASPPS